jgi:short subunit dehydrogenase-like uncharacterized protein
VQHRVLVMERPRAYDVILFGLGYTGRFVLEELLNCALREGEGHMVRIAVAGRSAGRMRRLCDETPELSALVARYVRQRGTSWLPTVECSSEDSASLVAAFQQARVVISAVGPFNALGTPVVEACIAARTHYVDICGETLFIERVIAQYHQQALDAGVTLVPACGFDCVPTDLSLYELQVAFSSLVSFSAAHARPPACLSNH